MATILRMPEIATGTDEARIQVWLVKRGDEVAEGQALVEIETDKATIDMEAEAAGVFAGALVAEDEMVAVGAPIGVLAAPGEDLDAALAEAGAEADVAVGEEPADPVRADGRPVRLFTSPLVRRLAKEHGLELSTLRGSGPNGRILKKDISELIAAGAAVAPTAAAASAQPVVDTQEWASIPHTGMRRAVARRLTESKSTVPHFYVVADCRMDALLTLRAQVNAELEQKVSVNDFIVKAVALALGDVPAMNAIWTDEAILRARHADVAVAVAVDGGLLTPVVRGVDTMPISVLGATVRDYAERARSGALKQKELEGGTFTVSNLGMYGTKEFSAIINPPHSGILAVGAASKRPVVVDDRVEVATMMTVTLSADHRVVDGAVAAEWLKAFQHRIEHPLRMLL